MIKLIEKLKGTLLGFGIDDDTILDAINDNTKITFCDLLNSNSKEEGFGFSKRKSMRQLKKRYGFKNIDNVLINYKEFKPYMHKHLSNFLNIGLVIYFYEVENIEDFKVKLERYNFNIKVDGNILKIEANDIICFRKRVKYVTLDTFFMIIDTISDMLT